jgi:putative transcriptional regulator
MIRPMRFFRLSLLLVVLLVAARAGAQAPNAGTLLVSTGALEDPNFAESVLLMIHHDNDGSLALLVNRPTNLAPSRVFPDEPALARYSARLFLGGPLAPQQLLVLLRDPPPEVADGSPVLDDVLLSADPEVLDSLDARSIGTDRVRLFAGHAAWGPGQLDAEIATGSWRVVPGRAELVFAREPLELWQELTRRGVSPGLVVDSR